MMYNLFGDEVKLAEKIRLKTNPRSSVFSFFRKHFVTGFRAYIHRHAHTQLNNSFVTWPLPGLEIEFPPRTFPKFLSSLKHNQISLTSEVESNYTTFGKLTFCCSVVLQLAWSRGSWLMMPSTGNLLCF